MVALERHDLIRNCARKDECFGENELIFASLENILKGSINNVGFKASFESSGLHLYCVVIS